jgi:hypothetical protein
MSRQQLPSTIAELEFPGNIEPGDKGMKVRRVQEWLKIHGVFAADIDENFGDRTGRAVAAFQQSKVLPATGIVDRTTWEKLTFPLREAESFVAAATNPADAVVATAQAHLAQAPAEVGGENRGPWVRYYCLGKDGDAYKWCQGFANYVFQQAFDALGKAAPFPTTQGQHASPILSVPAFVKLVDDRGKLVSGSDRGLKKKRHPGCFYFVRDSAGAYQHSGLVASIDHERSTFRTIDGNWSNKVTDVDRPIKGEAYDFGVYAEAAQPVAV